MIFGSVEQAEAAQASIGEHLQHVILIGEALTQFADDKRRSGCKPLSCKRSSIDWSSFLPTDRPMASISGKRKRSRSTNRWERRFATATHHAASAPKELYRWAMGASSCR